MALKFGSPAWQRKYNPRFKRKRKVYKQTSSRSSMAKRRSYTKKRRSYSRSSSFNIWGSIVGVGGVMAFEMFVEPMIPINSTYLNLGEVALGAWLSRKGGVVGNVGKAMVYINAYQLLQQFVPTQTNKQSASMYNY